MVGALTVPMLSLATVPIKTVTCQKVMFPFASVSNANALPVAFELVIVCRPSLKLNAVISALGTRPKLFTLSGRAAAKVIEPVTLSLVV